MEDGALLLFRQEVKALIPLDDGSGAPIVCADHDAICEAPIDEGLKRCRMQRLRHHRVQGGHVDIDVRIICEERERFIVIVDIAEFRHRRKTGMLEPESELRMALQHEPDNALLKARLEDVEQRLAKG